MKKLNLKGVTAQTWVRTLVLVIALISNLLVVIGKRTEEIDMDKTTEVLTYLLTLVSSVWAWWKNNSFTEKAQEADAILHDAGTDEILIESEMSDDE